MKTNYYVQTGDLEQAFLWAYQGVRRLPLNADTQYNLASVYELRGNLFDAVLHYYIADYLYEYDGKEDIGDFEIEAHIEDLIQKLESQCATCEDAVYKKQQMDWMKNLLELSKSAFGLINAWI